MATAKATAMAAARKKRKKGRVPLCMAEYPLEGGNFMVFDNKVPWEEAGGLCERAREKGGGKLLSITTAQRLEEVMSQLGDCWDKVNSRIIQRTFKSWHLGLRTSWGVGMWKDGTLFNSTQHRCFYMRGMEPNVDELCQETVIWAGLNFLQASSCKLERGFLCWMRDIDASDYQPTTTTRYVTPVPTFELLSTVNSTHLALGLFTFLFVSMLPIMLCYAVVVRQRKIARWQKTRGLGSGRFEVTKPIRIMMRRFKFFLIVLNIVTIIFSLCKKEPDFSDDERKLKSKKSEDNSLSAEDEAEDKLPDS